MPYTIKVLDKFTTTQRLRTVLAARLKKDGRFTADLGEIETMLAKGKNGPPDGSKKIGFGFTVTRVRLTKAKPYCGNHPGPCLVNPHFGPSKKPNARFLEWVDWVEFNNLVNAVLDKYKLSADVWSIPQDANGRMWIRKGMQARIRYDWEDKPRADHWAPLQIWNRGSEDQFRPLDSII